MVSDPIDLLTDPDRFFRDVAENGGLAGPTLVVLLVGVVSAAGGLPFVEVTSGLLPPEASAFAGIAYASAVVGGFLGAFFVWLLYAVVFHLVSTFVFDGDGPFTRTLAVAGWGFVPAIFSGIISGFLTYYALRTIAVPTDPTQFQQFMSQFQNSPYVLLAGGLGVLFLLWQAYIWVYGVKHARGIGLRDAAITVAIPAGIALLFQLYNLV